MRKTDSTDGKKHFRTEDRVFRVNDEWFFATREGDRGPYESRDSAQEELTKYLMGMDLHYEKTAADEEITVPKPDWSVWDRRPDAR